uniref:Uncharacterized protein n=1 Tax=Ditylenchus dipsaci TaxID=166011 RepID=A0A915CZR2_9BILA
MSCGETSRSEMSFKRVLLWLKSRAMAKKEKESKQNPKRSKKKPDDSKQLSKDSKKKGGSRSHTSNKSSEKHANQTPKKGDEPVILPRISCSKEGRKNRKHVKDLSNEQPNHSGQQVPRKQSQASDRFQRIPKNPSKIAAKSKAPIENKISSSNPKNNGKSKSRSKDLTGSKQHEKKGVLINDRQGKHLVSDAETIDPSKDSRIKKSDKHLKSRLPNESEKSVKDLKLKEGFKLPKSDHKKKEQSRNQRDLNVSEKPYISVVCINIYL